MCSADEAGRRARHLFSARDDVVAILPGIRNFRIKLVPACLGVTHEVEPVPRPAFAEVRGRRGDGPPLAASSDW